MKSLLLQTIQMTVALFCCSGQNAFASSTDQDAENTPRLTAVANDAAREASSGSATNEQKNVLMTSAATAARLDLDPEINGSIKDIGATPAEQR